MLVSVDVDKGIVTVYGNTIVKVPITQINKLATLLRGKTVQYVSEVTEVDGDEVLDMVREIADSGDFNAPAPEEVGDGRLWMRATGSGQLYLKLDERLKLQFQHPGDFIPLEKVGYDVAERFPVVQSLLKKQKLQIVSTAKMNEIKRQVAEVMAEREEKIYGDMIVDTSVKGKTSKELAAMMSRRHPGKTGEVIDMDDHAGDLTDMEGLTDEQAEFLSKGWGKAEPADDGEIAEIE